MKFPISVLFLAFLIAAAEPGPSVSPAEQLAALAKQGMQIHDNFYAELKKAGHDMPLVTAANQKYHDDAKAWAERATPLVEANPSEPATLDVILAMNEIY